MYRQIREGTILQEKDMNKINLKYALSALISILVASQAISASADEPPALPDYRSWGAIQFEPGSGSVGPVDPDRPTSPISPVVPPGMPAPPQGTPGALSIDFVSGIVFGRGDVFTKERTYYARPFPAHRLDEDGNKIGATFELFPNFAQVTDRRGEIEQGGWTLSVKQSRQFMWAELLNNPPEEENAKPGDFLVGAELKFTHGHTSADAPDLWVEPSEVISSITLSSSYQPVIVANPGEGLMTWHYSVGTVGNLSGYTEDHEVPLLDEDGNPVVDGDGNPIYETVTDIPDDKLESYLPELFDKGYYDIFRMGVGGGGESGNRPRFGPVSLTVPGVTVQRAAPYMTSLEWQLSVTPGNPTGR